MTPENLERHIRLQPLYRKMMGEWREFDRYYNINFGEGVVEDTARADEFNNAEDPDDLRLPLPIDPVNPKRGLWGMVDWSKLRYEQWGPDGEIAIFKLPCIHLNEEMDLPIKDHPFIVGDPETALIKALCKQDGV
jgi:hypothetical protein